MTIKDLLNKGYINPFINITETSDEGSFTLSCKCSEIAKNTNLCLAVEQAFNDKNKTAITNVLFKSLNKKTMDKLVLKAGEPGTLIDDVQIFL